MRVRQLAERAEARVDEANALIADLYQSGRVRPWVLLGPVMSTRPYDPGCGPDDSQQVTQAVLLVPEGLGVVFWDGEELYTTPRGPARWRGARRLFTPIADCRPLLRVHFLPFAAQLVDRLVRHIRRR